MLAVFRWKPIISVHSAKEEEQQQQQNSFLACTMLELINWVDSNTVNSQVKQPLWLFHMYGLMFFQKMVQIILFEMMKSLKNPLADP